MPNRRINIVGQLNMALIHLYAVLKLLVHPTLIAKLFTMGVVRDQTIIYAHYQLQTTTIQVAPVVFIKKMFPNHAFQTCFFCHNILTPSFDQ